ncbi:MAG: M24 family metallopeptidase [Acidimicrobiia bacterium]|nr:M24 family metallopeptidase [Acidimicrobiia bacterium]
MDMFKRRRDEFMKLIGDAVAIIPGETESQRNHDVLHPFRQSSDFVFLTGFEEPDAVAVFDPDHPTERYVLFVRPRDREREIWDGYRAGTEGAMADYGADAAYPISELNKRIRSHLRGHRTVYFPWGPRHEDEVRAGLAASNTTRVRNGLQSPEAIADPRPILAEMRLFKTDAEAELLRRACDISVQGHIEAMRFAQPGMHEYQVQAAMEYVFRSHGSNRDGYPAIVASGPNACILHYTDNRRLMESGDLLLIDAAAEFGFFSSDITRTFPVNGRFSAPQRAVYEVVLSAQVRSLEACVLGAPLESVHDTSTRVISEGLSELGLVPTSPEETLEMGLYREFFMHGTSHWLGLDVHDAGKYRLEGSSRPLEPGMSFTVEPGVYIDPKRPEVEFTMFPYDEQAIADDIAEFGPEEAGSRREAAMADAPRVLHAVPQELLGIGVRIEDDVLMTGDGALNMTAALPRLIEDVEHLCSESSSVPAIV